MSQESFERFPRFTPQRCARRHSTDPERFTTPDQAQGFDAEEAHVPHDEITLAASIRSLESEGLVRLTGGMELEVEGSAVQQVEGEQALASSSFVSSVAIVGEINGVALRHGDDSRILHDYACEGRITENIEDSGMTHFQHRLNDREKEFRRGGSEALKHCLASHCLGREGGEMHGNMIERGVTLGDRLEHSHKETWGVELAGSALDEIGFACDGFELGCRRQEIIIEHVQLAALEVQSRIK